MSDQQQNKNLEGDLKDWRSRGRTIDVQVRLVLDDVGTAQLWACTLTARQRAMRALKLGGLMWGLAVASVFVPVAHFVLVPGFLLAGPLAAWLAHRRTETLLGGLVDCPKCGTRYDVGGGALQWPTQGQCPSCRCVIRLQPVTADSQTG